MCVVIKEKDLKQAFFDVMEERFEKEGIPIPKNPVHDRLGWCVAAAYSKCLAMEHAKAEKDKQIAKDAGAKSSVKTDVIKPKKTKRKKVPEEPNAGVSLKSMGFIKDMTPEEKAREAEERRDAAEKRAELKSRETLVTDSGADEGKFPDGHPKALVEECKDCEKADFDHNKCRIYEEPKRAWKHKSGRCPARFSKPE